MIEDVEYEPEEEGPQTPDELAFLKNDVARTMIEDRDIIRSLKHLDTPEQIKQFAKDLIKGKALPSHWRTPEQIMTVIQYGRELGVGPVIALHNFYPVKGRLGMQVHLIAGLLAKADVVYELIEDYKPGQLKDNYITVIRFHKWWHGQDITTDFKFTLQEATEAGFTRGSDGREKENWTRMPKIMLRARCLALGARFVAPDALLGLYTIDELADAEGRHYKMNEEMRVTSVE